MIEGLAKDEVARLVPMQRLGRPEEVASAVAFLFSEEAAYITGQVLSVNGAGLRHRELRAASSSQAGAPRRAPKAATR